MKSRAKSNIMVLFIFLLINWLVEFYIHTCSSKCNNIGINMVKYLD